MTTILLLIIPPSGVVLLGITVGAMIRRNPVELNASQAARQPLVAVRPAVEHSVDHENHAAAA